MRPIQRNEFFYLAAILLPSYMTLQSFYGSNDIVDHLIKFLGVLTFLGMGYCAPDQDGEFVIIAYTLLWMWSALNIVMIIIIPIYIPLLVSDPYLLVVNCVMVGVLTNYLFRRQ